METLIVHPKNKEQLSAIKAVMKALKIDFKAEKKYNQEIVNKVLDGENSRKSGKPGLKIDVPNMWK
ncbi:DUF2683 family protein [Pedobacter rhizosphaerae]|uniref:Uncharacterized protein n=1 Tax=Pedobacter rhizosphaerae TaxID=390241 RepID=A0A1H9W5T0_9SPHI|nr:DUF2683 family protein [Pedobacter rhizosphaerae]SES29139.1 hypothetical protein SAMN04488023_1597 [Pedobacter rhizosphaerae]